MGKATIGDWNAICDVCGFEYKASKLRKRWDGLMVCKEDWETRHPQDLYRFPEGTESVVPWTRPEPSDTFVTDICTIQGRSSIVGYAVVGCSIVGTGSPTDFEIPEGTF